MIVFCALAGAAAGIFLNICIDQLPLRGSPFNPTPHCAACGRRLSPLEMAPVLSYLALRGRCRACGAAIPWRVPLVEGAAALLFAGLWLFYGPGWPLVVATFFTCVLLVIFFIDLEHRLVLDRVTYPASAAALAFSIVRSLPGDPLGLAAVSPQILACVAGGAVGFAIMFVPHWLTKGGIGGGDVKLGALMGFMLGLPAVLAGLFWGFAAGGLGAIVLLATGLRRGRDAVPYAPFLALGAWVGLLCGNQMMSWYLGRF